jgi:Tol biopolymer transport system component
VSNDGKVAFVHQLNTINPENTFDVQSGALDIGLWDGSEVRLLTDDEAIDTLPTITADGQTVIFISNRDRSDGDFYRIDLNGETTPTRLSIEADPAIASIKGGMTALYRMSADGSRLLFFAQLQEGDEVPYMMDTTTGELTRFAMPEGVQATQFDLSGDGTLFAFTGTNSSASDPTNQPMYVIHTNAPDTVTTIGERGIYGSIAVNQDGSAIGASITDFNNSENPLIYAVMRSDGSDPKTVSNDPSIIGVFGGRFFFRGD